MATVARAESGFSNSNVWRDVTTVKVKTITGYAPLARFLAEVSEHPIGSIPRTEIPSPYASGPTHMVSDWRGVPVIIVKTRHRRYEVFRVSGPLDALEEETR